MAVIAAVLSLAVLALGHPSISVLNPLASCKHEEMAAEASSQHLRDTKIKHQGSLEARVIDKSRYVAARPFTLRPGTAHSDRRCRGAPLPPCPQVSSAYMASEGSLQ